MIFDPRHCPGCRLLARATGSLHALTWFASLAWFGVRHLRVALGDVVVVLGPREAELPAARSAPSPLHACVMDRGELARWGAARGGRWPELVASLASPAPEGSAWALLATGATDLDHVALLHHQADAPRPVVVEAVARALVPDGGGRAETTLAAVFGADGGAA